MSLRSYADALAYIYGFTDYEKQTAYEYAPERFNLERVRRLLSALDDPHHQFKSIHIAGTKGKGSVAAMSERVLRQAGYRTGLFTSPHLHTFRERIRVNGELIPEGAVVEGTELLRSHAPSIHGLTTFELITALGFWCFSQSSVDIAVVEVGLGGRLDATNVITPLVSAITSISYDHTAILGTTLSAIAREKGGIIKPGIPVVSAPQPQEALDVIEAICAEREAPLSLVGRDWQWTAQQTTWQGQSFIVRPSASHRPEGHSLASADEHSYWIPLPGLHQLVNATVVVASMSCLQEQCFEIPLAAVSEGLRDVKWPGRLEVLGQQPWVVIDGAHNQASAQKLRRALERLFPHRRLHLIFATYRDKDIAGMMEVLLPISDDVIVTQFDSPRAARADELAMQIRDMGCEAQQADDIEQALDQARQHAETDDLICVTGSVRFTGEARMAWAEMEGLPLPPSDPPLPALPETRAASQ